jgi:DNA (cytosine-5)-methyltransferase 1
LAGQRNGLNGIHSSTFWEFIRILKEMGSRKPVALLIENVSGFISSANGADLALAVEALNNLGYYCDLLQLDAKHWVPQSRPRMFIVGFSAPLAAPQPWMESEIRPRAVCAFVAQHPELKLQAAELPPLPNRRMELKDVVERLAPDDPRWWTAERKKAFEDSLSRPQRDRLESLRRNLTTTWRTTYRRTRNGSAVWEIRADEIAGCLRTARGGSSKQALIQAGNGEARIRWMTSCEYARLMGAPNFDVSCVTENQALFGLGDAVCVPAIEWLGLNYLYPLVAGSLTAEREANVAASV